MSGYEMEILPLGPMGAEVRNIDLARVSEFDVMNVMSAWYRYDMLLFRNQKLSEDALLAFSRHFGPLDSPPNQGAGRKSPPGFPELYVVSNVLDAQGEPIGALGHGEASWHTDMSYAAQPPDASMLYSLEVPAEGGNTSFASMTAALARMPAALVERVRYLDIKHDGTFDSGGFVRKGFTPSNNPRFSVGTAHPIVIEHPVTGDHALYLGRRRNAYVMGLDITESERLLDELWSYVETVVYTHRWRPGDLVFWDNRTTMHRRDAFNPRARRIMHRTQMKGTRAPVRAADWAERRRAA